LDSDNKSTFFLGLLRRLASIFMILYNMSINIFQPTSLKTRFSRFVVFLIVSLLSIAGISHLSNYQSLERYNRTFKGFEQLLSFYENVEMMNAGITNYIYAGNTEELDQYSSYRDKAFSNLEHLKDVTNKELVFRFSLLTNMIKTYDEQVVKLIPGVSKNVNQKDYDSFWRLKTLIIDTYPFYTKLLTDEMKLDNTRLLLVWKLQLGATIIISILLLGLSAVFVVSFIRSITHPIEGLIENINLIKHGEFRITRFESRCIEIDTLLSSFSEMARKVHKNIKQLEEKNIVEKQLIKVENENLKISQLLTEARLAALQHQMNPHFLFNTLSAVSKLAYLEGAKKSSNLMIRTSRVLRYGLEMGEKTSNLSLEINSIEDYFEIQKIRIGERITFSMEVNGNFSEVRMPGMIIQPLIENCIIHGVQDIIRPAYVSLSVTQEGERVIVTIEDNGKGIEENLVNQLNSNTEGSTEDTSGSYNTTYITNVKDSTSQKTKSAHIGIQNVRKRLKLFFNDDYKLFFTSDIGCGTVITLDLPMKNGESTCSPS